MLRVVAVTAALGAAGIAAVGGLLALIWGASWSIGIVVTCFVGSAIWVTVGFVLFLRWLLIGESALALRVGAAAACAGLVFLSMWFEITYVARDECGGSSTGEQPLLAVPVSVVTGEPTFENDVIFDLLPCPGRPYKIREYGEIS